MVMRILASMLLVLAIASVALAVDSQSPRTASAHGIIDQQFDSSGGNLTIFPSSPMGQEFTPTLTPMVAADVKLSRANSSGDANITVRVRDATIDGAILGEVTQLVPEGAPSVQVFVHFDLPTPITLTPGQTYVLEVETDNVTHAMVSPGAGEEYLGGRAIIGGAVTEGAFGFRTYYQATTATPTPSPTSTTAPTSAPQTAAPTSAPTAAPAALPDTGGAPSDVGSSLPWLAVAVGALAWMGAGSGLWLANDRRRVR